MILTTAVTLLCAWTTVAAVEVMSLEECERKGLHFCYTGELPSNLRAEMNAAIEQEHEVKRALETELRASEEELDELRPQPAHARFRRFTQRSSSSEEEQEVSRDCNSVCCVVVKRTRPFSYYRDKDGWRRVVNTPEYPQRTVFRTENCHTPYEKCRGVRPRKSDMTARCTQSTTRHTIFLFNPSNPSAPAVQPRHITLPSACRCTVMSPFDLQQKKRATTNRIRRSALDMLELYRKISDDF